MPYTNKKANLPEDFHDLGEEIKPMKIEMQKDSESSVHYPSLYFENAEALSKLPKEGTAMIHFKKIMEKQETVMRDGKETKRHCVEIQINGIKPEGETKMTSTAEKENDDDGAIEMGLKAAEGTEEDED
jgi:hypothetical protein